MSACSTGAVMPDEREYKESVARQMVLIGVIRALVKSHPDPGALMVAWADVRAELGAYDQILSHSDDLGEDAEMTTLLEKELSRWTNEIHRKR
jgi:hypothetical protein